MAALDGARLHEVADQGDAARAGVAALGVPTDDGVARTVLARVQLALAVRPSATSLEDLSVRTDQEVVADVGEAATHHVQLVPEAHRGSRVLHEVRARRVVHDDLAERCIADDVVVADRFVGTPLGTSDDRRGRDPPELGGLRVGVGFGLASATCASNEAPAAMATAPAAASRRKRRRGSASSAMQCSHIGVSFGWDSTRDQRAQANRSGRAVDRHHRRRRNVVARRRSDQVRFLNRSGQRRPVRHLAVHRLRGAKHDAQPNSSGSSRAARSLRPSIRARRLWRLVRRQHQRRGQPIDRGDGPRRALQPGAPRRNRRRGRHRRRRRHPDPGARPLPARGRRLRAAGSRRLRRRPGVPAARRDRCREGAGGDRHDRRRRGPDRARLARRAGEPGLPRRQRPRGDADLQAAVRRRSRPARPASTSTARCSSPASASSTSCRPSSRPTSRRSAAAR